MAGKGEYTKEEARRALLHACGIAPSAQAEGKDGVLSVLRKLQCVQVDPIEACGTNHDLSLLARVRDYRKRWLSQLLYGDRLLFEDTCKMLSIMPIEKWPVVRHHHFGVKKRWTDFFRENDELVSKVKKALDDGPVSSRLIKGRTTSEFGWGRRTNLGNVVLSFMYASGDLVIHHREGKLKHYCRPEDVVPRKIFDAEPLSEQEGRKEMTMMIASASRLVSPVGANEQWYFVGKGRKAAGYLEELKREGRLFCPGIEGVWEKLYAPEEDRQIWGNSSNIKAEGGNGLKNNSKIKNKNQIEKYARFLAPLDPLLWSRRVFALVFGLEYKWEVYTPPKDRKYGYYALPAVLGGEVAGLIEPYKQKTGKIEIRNSWDLSGKMATPAAKRSIGQEVKRLEQMHL